MISNPRKQLSSGHKMPFEEEFIPVAVHSLEYRMDAEP
jgi:hypothetical protein